MKYQSTRNDAITASPAEAVLAGIAPDGGLYIPQNLSALKFPMERLLSMSAREISAEVLGMMLPDFSPQEMRALVEASYLNKFETEDLTPTVKVGDKFILELFRGPTSAFKDVALSVLPHLITASKKKCGIEEEILILTATSGDTGKAALEGFHDVPGVRIMVFYPEGGVSEIQRKQMTTQAGKNVCVSAIRGNFDDAQSGVKAVFAACEEEPSLLGGKVRLSSANSINIGRLAPQVMYYFKAYADLVRMKELKLGEPVEFVVPTGNFGDILAGYFAKSMGLPVARLLCASNANNVLSDFLETGVYDRNRPFYKTASPSMDILISSNLERMLFLLCGANATRAMMDSLKATGKYSLPAEALAALREFMAGGFADDDAAKEAIRAVYEEHGYVMDPHTAVGWKVSENLPCDCKTVVLSTASPFKFSGSVLDALGGCFIENEFDRMRHLKTLANAPVPEGLASLETRNELHTGVIDREQILPFVLEKAGQERW